MSVSEKILKRLNPKVCHENADLNLLLQGDEDLGKIKKPQPGLPTDNKDNEDTSSTKVAVKITSYNPPPYDPRKDDANDVKFKRR